MAGRARSVGIYTAGLFVSPMLVMPFVPGTWQFALAAIAGGLAMAAASVQMLVSESRSASRSFLHAKLLICSAVTGCLGVGVAIAAAVGLF